MPELKELTPNDYRDLGCIRGLHSAADAIEASPKSHWTREEIVALLRVLPHEIASPEANMAYLIGKEMEQLIQPAS